MTKTRLIQGGTLVLPSCLAKTDLLIEDGKIAKIGERLGQADQIIDATGLTVMPGAIDPQVHFREPGGEHKENLYTGSRAAAAGGVTSFLDMPNNQPPAVSADGIASKKERANKDSLVNYGFFIGATPDNLDELNQTPNVCGIKIFMGSSTGNLLVSEPQAIEHIFANGTRLIATHAEDESILNENQTLIEPSDVRQHPQFRDASAALSASELAVELSLKYQRRLHLLHLTTQEETRLLRRIPKDNRISSEVCPQAFLLIAPECYEKLGTFAQMNPPLRSKRHATALWQALKDGIIDCVATDHAPHTIEEKNQPYGKAPSGMPGVETLLPLMLNQAAQGLCSLLDVAKWTAQAPASLYRIANKGRIEIGYDADFALVDMNQSQTITNGKLHTKVNWSPYHHWTIQGVIQRTLVAGETVFCDGDIIESTSHLDRELQFQV